MQEQVINILVVDDDANYVEVIKHQLRPFQNRKFKIQCVNSGESALKTLKANQDIDLILMDYYLPNTNGVEVIKNIHEEKIDKPIILLTSNKDYRIAIEAMKYGVVDYLIKEETIDTMLPRAIINTLERNELNQKINGVEKNKMMTEKRMEAVQELVVTMCHEFNNPLAAIKISTDILLRQAVSTEQKKLLNKFNENIAHLEKQIIKLRDINETKKL